MGIDRAPVSRGAGPGPRRRESPPHRPGSSGRQGRCSTDRPRCGPVPRASGWRASARSGARRSGPAASGLPGVGQAGRRHQPRLPARVSSRRHRRGVQSIRRCSSAAGSSVGRTSDEEADDGRSWYPSKMSRSWMSRSQDGRAGSSGAARPRPTWRLALRPDREARPTPARKDGSPLRIALKSTVKVLHGRMREIPAPHSCRFIRRSTLLSG